MAGRMILPGRINISRTYVQTDPWEPLPQHPVIAAQPATGQHITALALHGDYLLLGYGDWNGNHGPVSVVGYHATTLEPVTLLSDVANEAFDRIRIIDGVAYLPKTDPREGWSNPISGGFATDEGGTWHVEACGAMIHTFDVIEWRGDLFVSGSVISSEDSATGQGAVFRRHDGVWSEVHRGDEHNAGARFYTLWVDEADRLCVAETAGSNQMRVWHTDDGTTWTTDGLTQRDWVRISGRDPVPTVTNPEPEINVDGYLWAYDPSTRLIARRPLEG